MQPLQRIFALAALILLLTAPAPAGAAWLEAPGRLKPQFSKLLYNPATLRFDKHRNLDIITVRYVVAPAASAGLQEFLNENSVCRANLLKTGPCSRIQAILEMNGMMQVRYRMDTCLDDRERAICPFPEKADENEWETIRPGTPIHHIYYELILRPERTTTVNRP